MGGNVKAAMTERPSTTLDCEACGVEFTRKGKHSRVRVCKSCRKRLNDPENLSPSLSVGINDPPNELTLELTIDTTVHKDVRVEVPCEKVDTEEIIAVLRIETDDDEIWYEDAFVASTTYGVSVKDTHTYIISVPKTESNSSVREEYQASMGDLFDANELTVTVQFTSEVLGSVSEEVDLPSYKLPL